ncbi:hypothetical protein SynA1562_00576 [Synechococcus sp. A15-62]|nr:hypothetical protein SynA1562_00576 [Synechococcus sp. A15-62]
MIAGLLKKRRQRSSSKLSTFLWTKRRQAMSCEIQSTRCGGSAAQT